MTRETQSADRYSSTTTMEKVDRGYRRMMRVHILAVHVRAVHTILVMNECRAVKKL